MKKFNFILLFLAVLIIGGFFWWFSAIVPANSEAEVSEKRFVVPKGASLNQVADELKKEGLIKSPLAFKFLVFLKGQTENIQAGGFLLSPSMTLEEIAFLLTQGSSDIWLTFPEGWRKEEFGRRLAANLPNFSYSQFLTLVEESEGYLFPDTYLFPLDADTATALAAIKENFQRKYSPELERVAKSRELTQKQVLIVASLVEREAKFDKDRPVIAGIILKRWQNSWPLQVDATLQFLKANQLVEVVASSKNVFEEFDWWPKSLEKADFETDSPYNTYLYKGLPPAPICNPGLASIKAVIHPQETDYWFYLSDYEGNIYYAKTNEEHQANVEKYLKRG